MDAEGSGMGRLSIAEAVCQPGGTARGWGNAEPDDLRGGFYSLGRRDGGGWTTWRRDEGGGGERVRRRGYGGRGGSTRRPTGS
jgi:hypothetical protein